MSKQQTQPNLLFVFADQWRRQAVGCMKEDPIITPAMDQFASEGVLFENAFSCCPVCTPNRASIITGKHPYSMNMMYNWLRLPVEENTIAKVAKENGYNTGYIGKWHLDEHEEDEPGTIYNAMTPAGERRVGFDFWHANGCFHQHFQLNYITTDNQIIEGEGWQVDYETDVAVDYIKGRNKEKPFCLFLSWSPPHTNHGGPHFEPKGDRFQYNAPEKYEAMYRGENIPRRKNADAELYDKSIPGYFGAITSMDDNFARLMKCLDEEGLAEDTIVVLTADHGEMLGSHERMTKGIWYEESVGIPFIVRWTGKIPEGIRENMLFNTPDMMPSLLGLMGCPIPDNLHGKDYSRVMLGEEVENPDAIFFGFNGGSPPSNLTKWSFTQERGRLWRGVRTKRYTYVAAQVSFYADVKDGRVLYDLEKDPYQMNPIYPGQGYDEVIAELHEKLSDWLDFLGDKFLEETWKT